MLLDLVLLIHSSMPILPLMMSQFISCGTQLSEKRETSTKGEEAVVPAGDTDVVQLLIRVALWLLVR